MMSDPVIVDPRLLNVLKTYVEQKYDDLSCLVAKFLNAYVNDTPLVESFEVDNFILRNESVLCAWYVQMSLSMHKKSTHLDWHNQHLGVLWNSAGRTVNDPACAARQGLGGRYTTFPTSRV